MSTITWLHLSDLHFRADKLKAWDQDIVLRALLDDIQERITSDGLRLDLMLASGDIAFSGQPEEYALAGRFFDDLLRVTGLSRAKLFMVPGNHDVNRRSISIGAKVIASSLENRQAVTEALTASQDRRLIFSKFDAYAQFVNDYSAGSLWFDDEHYFYVSRLDLAGQRVAVIGLNSAWLSIGDQDFGRLAMGERQVRQALEQSRDTELRIALVHHPFDWLQEFDRDDCEPLLLSECDFILHGHLHRTDLQRLETPDARAMIFAAGAGYETRLSRNSYNWVQFDLASRQGTAYLRMYSDRQGGFWTKDVLTYKNVTEGKFGFSLPSAHSVISRSARPAPVAPVPHPSAADHRRLEANYLRLVMKTSNVLPLAIIDPQAFERTHQQTMDLLPIYVALNTRTQVPVEKKGARKGKRRQQTPMEMEPGRETRSLPALEAATRERQMVLLGDPGSGKSTFANYLALCLAGARLEQMGEPIPFPGEKWLANLEPTWTHAALLPLQIVLRQFAKSEWCNGTAEGLWNFVVETLTAQGLGDFAPILREQLMAGSVLVLLDGLDEVADPDQRQVVRDAVAGLAVTHSHTGNRYLVTCRSYAYQDACCQLDRFAVHTLAPFNPEQIESFIACWHDEVCQLRWKSEAEAHELKQRLQAATLRPDLAPLATSPLQLAMMASLQFSWGRLPDDRVHLYQEMVRLLLVRWQEARLGQETGVTQTIGLGDLESALERVAFVAHREQAGAEGTADISQATLLSILKDYLDGSWDQARQLVSFIQERAGLLIDRGKGAYTFPHRSYQEYLAGAYLAVQPDFPDEAAHLARENYSQWREVILWAVGVMARLKKMTHVTVDVAAALCPHEAPTTGQAVPEADWHSAYLAGETLVETGVKEVRARQRHMPVLTRVQTWQAALLSSNLPPVERAQAGNALAALGDPRDLEELVAVPAGPFWMGSDKATDSQAWDDELPQHEVLVSAFRICKYPATVRQWKQFVESTRYANSDPRALQGPDNHPVVWTSWRDAQEFCRWLTNEWRRSGKIGQDEIVCLPTEAEWEKAARGTDKRIRSWGDEPDPGKANVSETGIGGTSAVGIFPTGASPYGCLDMIGNVWEWTHSKWEGYPYQANDGREELAGDSVRVVRGGAFDDDWHSARAACRDATLPDSRDGYRGFRVVVVAPGSRS